MDMHSSMGDDELKQRLRAARALAKDGRVGQAIDALQQLQRHRPDSAEVAIAIARLSAGDTAVAEHALELALAARPGLEAVAVEQAVMRANMGRLRAACEGLQAFVGRTPTAPFAWLVLGKMLDDGGRQRESLLARFEALAQAHALGVWLNPEATPPHLVASVQEAARAVLTQRHTVFDAVLDPVRAAHGVAALTRIEQAVSGYLKRSELTPPDPMQRPRFLYVPGLPTSPFLDTSLQPWTPKLRAAYPEVRDEAVSLLAEGRELEEFIKVRGGDRIGNYLGGVRPSWDAFFFYRRGQRYDENHRRCPRTSALLESIDLTRIPGQTPEICFSVLAADTHILPHHGVTNARTVMHLPLVVPPHCALNLVDRGTHHWIEGEPVMFDDTFLHEAWNRSDSIRVILLMDCWNPHLTEAERAAVVSLSRAIGVLDVAYASSPWLRD
jgi:aspartate beta-hydroxylase